MKKKLITIAIQSAILSGSLVLVPQVYAVEEQEIERNSVNTIAIEKKADEDVDEKITVTGSRLRRDSFNIATPIVVMGRAEIEDSGLGSLSEILVDEIPSLSEGSSNSNSQSSVQNTGLSTIQLRNLGTNRTLTLIDGRRVVSNSYSGNYVSLSTIPSGMVDRVEIISGGASAAYGSDAIAGVVNIITQSDKEGFAFKVRGGETTEGGGKEFTLDLNYGTSFANDRAYMYFSSTYDKQFGLFYEDRKRAQVQDLYDYDGDKMCNTMQNSDGDDQCMSEMNQSDWSNLSDGTLGGVFLESSRNDEQFWYDESGLRNDWKGNEERFGVNSQKWVALKVPDKSFVNALKFDYELTDDTTAFFQIQHSINDSVNVKSPEDEYESAYALTLDPETGAPGRVRAGYIPIDNPYVPQEMIDSNPYKDRIYWDRRFAEVGDVTTDNTRTTIRSWAGLQGTVFDDAWDWEVSASFGKFKQEQTRYNELNTIRVGNALNAEYADDGTTIQCADEAARAEGCAPLNIFGIGSISNEAADYIRANPTITTKIEQVGLMGYVTGDLFELPAGPVGVVLGAEYRQDSQDVITSEEQRNGGVTFNVVPTFSGEVDVYEIFGEIALPLLKDVVGAKRLDAEFSARIADYSMENVGTVGSYTAKLFWQPIEGYSFRANYAIAQRAPTITELMSPPRGDYDTFTDICYEVTADSTDLGHDNCRLDPVIASVIAEEGIMETSDNNYSPNTGNNQLKEETGKTLTFGVTLAPDFIEDFLLAVDYYDITVEDAIAQIDNDDIMKGCYASPAGTAWGADNEFCQNLTRDGDGGLIEILQRSYNLDELSTRGFDIVAEYKYDLGDYGRLKFKANYNHVLEFSKSFDEDGVSVTNEYAGYLNHDIFESKAAASVTWYKEGIRLRWSTKFKGDIVSDDNWEEDFYSTEEGNEGYFVENDQRCSEGLDTCIVDPEKPAYLNIGSYIRHDVSISYKMDLSEGTLRLFAGVNNVFDNDGDFIIGGKGNYDSTYGGGMGRFAYVGAEVKF